MANVRVAVRVRPLSPREAANGGRIIIEIDDKVAKIKNLKVDSRTDGLGGSREKVVAFGFDYCYWSVNPEDPQYASQDVVFQDLGTEVLSGAAKGYNICLFAYGQTGSGKTYTMIGTPASLGLTPRICEGLFSKKDDYSKQSSSCRIRVSFLEIYNEKVRDLLKQSDQKKPYTLRVREHPETGPYVQGLSQHVVTNYKQIMGLLEEGVANRITAATHVHEASSRSHAIFTIYYTQAILENNLPSEIASKINLVDLAGSERADPSYCKDRITEGASINKSLVTLGIVISSLAQNSQMFSYQSPNSTSSEGGDSGSLGSPSVAGSLGGAPRRQSYIPYRDSVLTWLLKDSLGGNSKTIMVATVSPANSSYSETMSTLRYASSAKNIINKPRVNEDANIKLIRELREEIQRLKAMLLSFELGNLSPFTGERNGNLSELVLHNELKIDQLSKEWIQKWDNWKALMEQYCVDINKKKAGVTIDSNLPHLMALDDDVLSTGIVLYHLRTLRSVKLHLSSKKEGTTKIGRIDSDQEQDIVLQGQWIERDHCTITSVCGVVTLQPSLGARCIVNGQEVTASCRLTQGAIIILGETQKFRFIHPAEAAALRQRRSLGEVSAGSSCCSLAWLNLDSDVITAQLGISSVLEDDRRLRDVVPEGYHPKRLDQAVSQRTQIRQQKRFVKDLKQEILAGEIRAEQELELEQALINRQIKDNQRWLLREKSRLASLQQQQQHRQDNVSAEADLDVSGETESQTGLEPEASSASLDGGRKRLAQLQVLWRNALRAAERKVRRKKVKFQLERIIKKQKLLEAQTRLEQLETLCWDDSSGPPRESDPGLDATFPTFQKKSKSSSSSSSLGNQRLCGLSLSPSASVLKYEIPANLPSEPVPYIPEKPQSEEYLLQASVLRGSATPHSDSCPLGRWQASEERRVSLGENTSAQGAGSAMSTKIASAMDDKSQEMDRNKQMVRIHRNLVSVSRLSGQLKSREKPDSLLLSPRIVRAKPSGNYSQSRQKWRKEGDLPTIRASRGNSSSSPHPPGARRLVRRGKVQTTRLRQAARALQQEESSVSSSSRSLGQLQGHLVAMKDRDRRFSQVSQKPVKRGVGKGTRSTEVQVASSTSVGAKPQENENDFSDTDSTYSLDSLSCTYTRIVFKPPKQEADEPKPCCEEPENSESDDSQMSQDSLMEKRSRAQRRRMPCPLPPQVSERSEAGPAASPKASLPPPGNGLPWKKERTFSLDSLDNLENASREESRKELNFHSSDEMPAEVFWQLNNSRPLTECEKPFQFQASDQGPGVVRSDETPLPSGSFYLGPQPQSETDRDGCNPPQQTQHLRNNSLVSVDSWFSCDSGSNHNGSQEVELYSQVKSNSKEPEVKNTEKSEALVKVEELQQQLTPETATEVYSFSPFQGLAPAPSRTNVATAEPSSDASSEATSRSQGPCQPGLVGSASQESFHPERRGLRKLAGHCSSAPSNSTLTSSLSATSASLLSHKGSTQRKGWPLAEYLREFSHSALGATGKSTQVSSCPQKDTSCLSFTSGKSWDSFPVGPKICGEFDFNDLSLSSSSTGHPRLEREHDGVSFEFDDLSTFFRTIEKDAHHSCSSTDLEAGDSRLENAWVFATENKVSTSLTEVHPTLPDSLTQPQPLICEKAGSTVSFDESFFLRDISNTNSPMNAKEEPTWAQQEQSPPPGKLVPLGPDSDHSQTEMKAEHLQKNEDIDRESFFLAFPTTSELFSPAESWDSFPSEQLPPLETFYVLESRDALTETALEIPACREWGEDLPPTGGIQNLNNPLQFLRNFDSDLLFLLHTPKPKNSSFHQIVAERSISLDTLKDPSGTGVPQIMEKYNSVSFSSAQNRLLPESSNMEECELGKPTGILNNKHPQLSPNMKEKTPARPPWGISVNDAGATKPLPLISSMEVGHDHRQSENDFQGKYLLGIGTADFDEQIHSGSSSHSICQSDSSSLSQHRVSNAQEKVLVPTKHGSSSHSECTSPVTIVKDETLSHSGEGTESVYIRIGLHLKDCSEEPMPHRGDHPYGKDSTLSHPSHVSIKEADPTVSQEPESLMVTPDSQGKMSQRRNQVSSQGKIVNHSEEMTKLINSVSQLESSIFEIESKQKCHPHSLHVTEGYRKATYRERKNQERAHHPLRRKDFRDSPSYKDQTHTSKKVQEEEVVPNSMEARGIKDIDTCIQENHQAQKSMPGLTKPTEFMEENKVDREQTLLPAPKPSIGAHSDHFFKRFSQRCNIWKKPTNVPEIPEISEPSVRIEPLRPQEERSEGSSVEETATVLNSESHAVIGTGYFPELEPKVSFQESQDAESLTNIMIISRCEEPRVHDMNQEVNAPGGKSMQREVHADPLAQELPSISQIIHMGRFGSEEMVHPLPSQEGYLLAPPQEEPGKIFFSDPPKLSGSYFRTTAKAGSFSSTSSDLELEFLKMKVTTSSEGQIEQKINGDRRTQSSVRSMSCKDFFGEHPLWQSFQSRTGSGLHCQPDDGGNSLSKPSGDSSFLEEAKEHQGEDGRIPSKDSSLGSASLTEAEVILLRNIKRANSLNQRLLEKRGGHQRSDSDPQMPQILEKKPWRTEDFSIDHSTTITSLSAGNEGKPTRTSSGIWGGSVNTSKYSEVNVVDDITPSEEYGKSTKDSASEQIITTKPTRVLSGIWGSSVNSSIYPETNEDTTMEDTKQSERCGKSSKESAEEQSTVPILTRASSGLWGASANSSIYPEVDVDTTVEDARQTEEYGKLSKDSTKEHSAVPTLTRVSSGLWGASVNSSMYPEVNVETTVEDAKLPEECGKSPKDNTEEQTVVPKLTKVSSGIWGASANSSIYPEVNVEGTVEDIILLEDSGKSKASPDEQITAAKLMRASSGIRGTSANSSMYPEGNVEATGEEARLSEECRQSPKESTEEQVIGPYSDTLLDPKILCGTTKPHYNQRDQLESSRTQDKDESQVCFVQNNNTRGHAQEVSPGTALGKHLDKSNLLTSLYVADGFQLMTEITPPSRGSEHASQLSSSTFANAGISKSSNLQATVEKLTGDFDPKVLSENANRKEEVMGSPTGGLLSSGSLLFPSTLKESKRDELPRQSVLKPSLHAISDSIRAIQQELSQALPSRQMGVHSEVERTSPGSKESIRRAWGGFRSQSTAYESLCGGDSGNSSEATGGTSLQSPWKDTPILAGSEISVAEMSYVTASSTLWPVFVSQDSFHIRKPVSCEAGMVEAEETFYFDSPLPALDIKQPGSLSTQSTHNRSSGLDERRSTLKQNVASSRAVGADRTGEQQQCQKVKRVTLSGESVVAYGASSICPRSASFLDQNLAPASMGETENCPEESVAPSIVETSESSIAFIPSASQERAVTSPSKVTGVSQQGTAWVNSPLFSNPPSYGTNNLEKRTPRSSSDTVLPAFLVSSKSGVDGSPRGASIPLTQNLELREVQTELRLAGGQAPDSSAASGTFSLAQSQGSSLASEVGFKPSNYTASSTGLFVMESPGREEVKKKVPSKPETTSLPARTYSEKLEKHKTSQNDREFSPVSESGHRGASGRLKSIHEGILENEPTVGSPCRSQGPPFPKDPRDHSISVSHARTEGGKKYPCNKLPGSLWEKEENGQSLNNVGSTMWHKNQHHSGASVQASPQESRDISKTNRKVARPERIRFFLKRNNGPFDVQGSIPRSGQKKPVPTSKSSRSDQEAGCLPYRSSASNVAFPSSPKRSPKDFSPLKLSIKTPPRSLRELNMSVEPPSPTEDEESRGTERLFLSDLSPDESEMMIPMKLGKFARSVDCGQTALSHYNSEAPSPQPPESGTAPYPTSSTLLVMPGSEGRLSDSLAEEQRGRRRKSGWLAPESTNSVRFTSGNLNPFLRSWQQEAAGRVGWKQYMFGSASDISCSQTSWGQDTQRAIRCSSVDNGLDSQSSPFHSQLSSYANTQGPSSTLSSIEDPRASEEERKNSQVLRNRIAFLDAATTRTTDMLGKKSMPEEDKLSSPDDSALTEGGSVSGQMEATRPLYPSETESWPKASTTTCEQGTVTPLSVSQPPKVNRHCQGCIDVAHPSPEAAVFLSHPPSAAWTNMQSLSMHLSQLLHNTSELLGNLTHQGTAEKERERGTKAEVPEEALRASMMDGSTQTTVDVGIQTEVLDSAPHDGFLHSQEDGKLASPQEAGVVTQTQGLDVPDTAQEKADHPAVLQEKEPEGAAEKPTSSSPGSQRHHLVSQGSPSMSHCFLSFQKHPLSRDPLNLPVSPATSPSPSSQMDGSSSSSCTALLCTAFSTSGLAAQEGGSTCDSSTQKTKKAGYKSTPMVDRASSPILTLSASTQGPWSASSSPSRLRIPRSHSAIHHQRPGVARGGPASSSQACDEEDTKNISGDGGNIMGKDLSKESPDSSPAEVLKQNPWLRGSLSSMTSAPFTPHQQSWGSSGLLGKEEHQVVGKKKHGSREKLLYASLPMAVLSPTEDQVETSDPNNFLGEASLEGAGPILSRLVSRSLSGLQKRTSVVADALEQPLKSASTSESTSWPGILNYCHCPLSSSEVSGAPGLGSMPRDTQSEVLNAQVGQTPESKHYSLRDLPVHNKFSNWCGVQGSSPQETLPGDEVGNIDSTSSEGMAKPAPSHECLSQVPEQLQREQVQVLAGVPLELGPQTAPLSVELAEAKLLYGLGETDALLRVMQSGTGEALVPVPQTSPPQEEIYFRHLKTIEAIQKERADRLQNFRRARSLSPMKQLNLLPSPETPARDPDLPSRRREYLQQLRKDVVETTRNMESGSDSGSHQPSDIEVLLRDYQRAREETKVEIARARDRLRERAEQEKQRIRQHIVSQLQREEAKLQSLVSATTLCTMSSTGSLSSSPTSGYDSSSLTLSSQSQPPEKQGDANLSCFKEASGGEMRGRSVLRNHQLYLTEPAQKDSGHKPRSENRVSLDVPQKTLLSQSSSDSCLSSSLGTLYHDLVKHILASAMAEVMAACSDNLQNLFSRQAAAGWKYQGEEKDVLTYYKGFPSATRHGFLGAGVVPQPLPRVWAAVRDPTMWTLYNKSIQTAQLHQRVTNSIKLVYLVSNTSMSCLKQPRDFCCVSAEAKEGHLTIMVAQSVYDKSMPRPSRNMIRGEILPSAWVLQPHTMDGKEVTKVIHMVQVELGAPGLPPGLLTYCAKHQPLVIANLASFLCG